MKHWAQAERNKNFAMYDWGYAGNMRHYNQPTAPLYNFTNYPISVPLAMFTGDMDELADPTDVAFLLESLPMAPVLHVVCSRVFVVLT